MSATTIAAAALVAVAVVGIAVSLLPTNGKDGGGRARGTVLFAVSIVLWAATAIGLIGIWTGKVPMPSEGRKVATAAVVTLAVHLGSAVASRVRGAERARGADAFFFAVFAIFLFYAAQWLHA